MPRHPDFEKIYRQFLQRYCGSREDECEKGKDVYYAWLSKLGLDDTRPYEGKMPAEQAEGFSWVTPHFSVIRQDREARYYEVEALFPLVSMNRNLYTEAELLRGARTLKGSRRQPSRAHSLLRLTREVRQLCVTMPISRSPEGGAPGLDSIHECRVDLGFSGGGCAGRG